MTMFKPTEITAPAIIHCGAGAVNTIAAEVPRFASSVAIITGGHLEDSDEIYSLKDQLALQGVDVFIPEPVRVEPTVDTVDRLVSFISEMDARAVVAIGGGSVMDAAKAAAIVAPNGGRTEDYQLKKKEFVNPPLPQVFAPTTAGTGSESTRVSVLTNELAGVKRSISHPQMVPDVVVMDPHLTVSCPNYITTLTAMDAFAHAIESAVSRNANSYSRHVALAGIEQLSEGLPICQKNPGDLEARLACLVGASFAGLAMQEGLGATHSLAPAICIVSGIRHSEAIAALLPHVIRLNEAHLPGTYDEVRCAIGADDVASRLEELCATGNVSTDLSHYGLRKSQWPKVLETMSRYASHRQTNPVEVTDSFAWTIYEAATSR